jgi:hypothetical protein
LVVEACHQSITIQVPAPKFLHVGDVLSIISKLITAYSNEFHQLAERSLAHVHNIMFIFPDKLFDGSNENVVLLTELHDHEITHHETY